jgi:hypothetical protein
MPVYRSDISDISDISDVFAASSTPRTILTIAIVLSIAAICGCSFSKSSESISNSISSPSDWSRSSSESSSGSSGGDDGGGGGEEKAEQPETQQDAQSYAEDVTQLAYTYGKQGGDIGALRSGVTTLASKRGITNWEVDSITCQSIGKGVGKAGMSQDDFTKFSQSLFGGDLLKANELRTGYETIMPAAAATDAPAPASAPEATSDPQGG